MDKDKLFKGISQKEEINLTDFERVWKESQKNILEKYILKWENELKLNQPPKVFEEHYITFIKELKLELKKLKGTSK